MSQWLIYKINSSVFAKANWNLDLDFETARRNEQIVTVDSSQAIRWILEARGKANAEVKIQRIKDEIVYSRHHPDGKSLKSLYNRLNELQHIDDYVTVVMERTRAKSDYNRACKGFTLNGKRYVRFMGTPNGVKQKTIAFIAADIADAIMKKADNGRDKKVPLIPAKLEAYRALICSTTDPVSMPNGIIVVPDCETKFLADIIHIRDSDIPDGEPILEEHSDYEVELNASDGCGMILPALAERWSEELGLSFVSSGFNLRYAFTKGMVFAFDFREFATTVAGTSTVVDVWGHEQDVMEAELILTASQLKLWESYKNMKSFLRQSQKNGYIFGISKECKEELDNERELNYQFLASYDLTNDEIEELCRPTVEEIEDILSGDFRKTLIYLNGDKFDHKIFERRPNDWRKALAINPAILDDIHIKRQILDLIRGRIKRAKIGRINAEGNFANVSGDLYALCQSIFGLPVTGVLKAKEVFSQYWLNKGTEAVACYRAPMSVHNNIRLMNVSRDEAAAYWYRYMPTAIVLNAWDTAMIALNGLDKIMSLTSVTV